MFGPLSSKSLRQVIGLLSLILLLSVPAVLAQTTRSLEPGTSVTGTLDSDNVAQLYTFAGNVDDVVSLTATSSTGLGLALLVADSAGETVAQGFESSSPTTLADITLPATDTFYVTVLSAMGVTLPTGSTFELTFDIEVADAAAVVEATPVILPTQATVTVTTPGQILTTQGLEVSLSWASLANMDLEVRDPVGGSVFFSTPTTPSGGQFGVNVNSSCDTRSADAPTESAAWPGGALPTGSYEILVYYQPLDNCPTTEAVDFDVTVTLDGQTLDDFSGNVLPNETFISSFVVGAEGTLEAGPSGLYTDPTILPAPTADLLNSAQPIQRDIPVTGTINRDNFFDTYNFQGSANDLITVNLTAQSGSLDTLALLLDSAGNVLTNNDDVATGENTNSSIANFRLLRDDTYTIVATRYGKDVGGTEGDYTLLLTGPSGDLPAEILDLGLPRGDVEIALSWNTNADLQLLVRDPRGDSVFDDAPQVPSNGRLAASGNVNCTVALTSPVSYVYWPEGTLIPGLYEIEVWYQNACNDTTPVTFSLNILVNGTLVFSQTAQPEPNDVYLTSFVIDVDQQVRTSDAGFIGTRDAAGTQLDSTSLDFRSGLASAQTILSGQTTSGSITFDDKFDLYRIEGEAGDVVTIGMVATAGRLDTALFLLDPNGFQIADNDDAVVGESTDSLISEFTLPEDGVYTIIATHFGMQYGGTTGAYDLVFSRLN